MAQDGELSVCAHADAWMVLYTYFLRGQGARFTMPDILDAVSPDVFMVIVRRPPQAWIRQLGPLFKHSGCPRFVIRLRRFQQLNCNFYCMPYLISGLAVLAACRVTSWSSLLST